MRKLTTDEISDLRRSPSDITEDVRLPVIAVLEDIRSLYNVGSMFRTADSALLKKIVLTGFTPHPPRKEIEKTALGATKTIPWEAYSSAAEPLSMYRQDGWTICAIETTDASLNLYQLGSIPSRVVLVFGNEITGIRDETLRLCDQAWEIPMFGTKHSLNVSVAFGIVTHELGRRLR